MLVLLIIDVSVHKEKLMRTSRKASCDYLKSVAERNLQGPCKVFCGFSCTWKFLLPKNLLLQIN